MKQKLFFYPQPLKKGHYLNPYSSNFKNGLKSYFDIVDADKPQTKLKSWGLLTHTFSAKVYILNWVESIPHLKLSLLQTMLVMISLLILKVRQVKLVWMFHNIHPHQGENWKTRLIANFLFRYSSLIISHSKEAAEYATKCANCNVYFRSHPILKLQFEHIPPKTGVDVFIWGSIFPYKGVVEFLASNLMRRTNFAIRIIGSCKDEKLNEQIQNFTNQRVVYENRKAAFEEICSYCQSARFVVFPYVGKCVSSSGALMDTIMMGGIPVGPNVGAFKDLEEEGVCLTYSNYEELFRILSSDGIGIDHTKQDLFIKENSWDAFSNFLYGKLKALDAVEFNS